MSESSKKRKAANSQPQLQDPQDKDHNHAAEKEKKRQKMFKRMGKLLGKAWNVEGGSEIFQSSGAWNLGLVGQKLDEKQDYYQHHVLQSWQAFANDLGAVYTGHISGKTKHAKLAKEHLEQVKALLSEKDPSLAEIASKASPHKKAKTTKKRTSTAADNDTEEKSSNRGSKKARKGDSQNHDSSSRAKSSNNNKKAGFSASKHKPGSNKNPELAEREIRAMEQLREFIVDKSGGTPDMIEGFGVRVTKKQGEKRSHQAKYDVNFYSPENRRFRSMLEVGRVFNLVHDGKSKGSASKSGTRLSKEEQAEKKKIRRELDRLRKTLNRANANLDKFEEKLKEEEEEKEDSSEAKTVKKRDGGLKDDAMMVDNGKKTTMAATRRKCAGTRLCDVAAFPLVPQHCIPDVLMAWDFLCTFHRVLSLQPIELPDFCAALAYKPPATTDDLTMAPPVYLVETHLSLLKLLFHDRVSDDWWWSTVETDADLTAVTASSTLLPRISADETEKSPQEEDEGEERTGPVIKIDIAQLLSQDEDPLITTSWLKLLEGVGSKRGKAVRAEIKGALKMTRNKWVLAYLKKALVLFRSSSGGPQSTRQAIQWLVDSVTDACPHLKDRSVSEDEIDRCRAKVVEESQKQMQSLSFSSPTVTEEDVVSDPDDDESDESDDEDDEEEEAETEPSKDGNTKTQQDDSSDNPDDLPATSIPPRPVPSLVDLLLPNEKPSEKADYINPFTWSSMTGATVHRILHRKKRIWNEVDDMLRANQELSPLNVPQRRDREKYIAARVLTECCYKTPSDENTDIMESAIQHLASGLHYLDLSFAQRLGILRLLIEAAYDSIRIYDVVVGNYNQRTSAMKALEQEKRKAKNHAKEKASADEVAAREKLAEEAREKFLDEKREEIVRLNEASKELSDEMVESLTDEDILDFDEDIRADYDALPTPESFSRGQVSAKVERMREEAAFDTDALHVLTFDEILKRETSLLEEMEGQLLGFGGEQALDDPSLDRETIRAIEELRRDIEKTKTLAEKLPDMREKAILQLKDAMEDGTIKVLRNAVTAAKKAKLSGPDDETGGVWALDLLRDAALELENAKQNKKLIDAQKDLVAKRNKCFIRTEPLGRDRFGNRFWTLANEEDGNVWAEAEFCLKEEGEQYDPPPGYADVVREQSSIVVGAADNEEDFLDADEAMDKEACVLFSRREYHSSGSMPHLVRNQWGCHTSEESIRKVIRSLDEKEGNEMLLKASLKESLEKVDKQDSEAPEPTAAAADDENPGEKNESTEQETQTQGDEDAFASVKKEQTSDPENGIANSKTLTEMTSALGKKVRVRIRVGGTTKDNDLATYETGTVTGWKHKTVEQTVQKEARSDSEDVEMETETVPKTEAIKVPIWRVWTELGSVLWLDGLDLLESLSRKEKMDSTPSYFEHDAAFLGYRNMLGKFSGSKADAPYASSPFQFAKLMVKREAEIFPKLKIRSYDERWGGKTGERAAWTNKMKDYAFDTETVKQGLLTLEKAFFWLTGEFEDYNLPTEETPDAVALLDNPATRVELELESDNSVEGLWNSPESRAVFIEVVSRATTTGFLALALELLCRNVTKYMKKHSLLSSRSREPVYEEELTSRRSRRRGTFSYQEPNYDDLF